MAYLILIALLLVPVVEVALFIVLGSVLGLWPTLSLAVATALAGTALIRHQGFGVLARAQAAFADNRLPVAELFDALCLFVAGALLLTPGFATDLAGALLLVPALRRELRSLLLRFVQVRHTQGGRATDRDGAPIIDGDYQDISDDDATTHRLDRR